MKKLIVVLLALATVNVFGSVEPTSAKSIQVERVQANENTALVKVKGLQKMLLIPQMTDFSPEQLNQLNESQAKGSAVQVRINSQNQIVGIGE
jgi:hypothetical protein